MACGELRVLHLGAEGPAAGSAMEWRRGVVYVGDALEAAVRLLDASAKGEVLVEGREPIRASKLGPEAEQPGSFRWFSSV